MLARRVFGLTLAVDQQQPTKELRHRNPETICLGFYELSHRLIYLRCNGDTPLASVHPNLRQPRFTRINSGISGQYNDSGRTHLNIREHEFLQASRSVSQISPTQRIRFIRQKSARVHERLFTTQYSPPTLSLSCGYPSPSVCSRIIEQSPGFTMSYSRLTLQNRLKRFLRLLFCLRFLQPRRRQ